MENPSHLRHELENRIRTHTGRRIRDLAIELRPERVVLRGHTSTYYLKQLCPAWRARDLAPRFAGERHHRGKPG